MSVPPVSVPPDALGPLTGRTPGPRSMLGPPTCRQIRASVARAPRWFYVRVEGGGGGGGGGGAWGEGEG